MYSEEFDKHSHLFINNEAADNNIFNCCFNVIFGIQKSTNSCQNQLKKIFYI